MNREQSALWQRIQGFEIDDPAASFPFSARLARENGWTRGFALRVVEQYKRFVFLAMVASHEVTPSDEVDEAWHLHLTYTHSYWNGLCRDVLGKSLHHVPTRGGSADAARHHAQYEQTLASYRELFGQAAPADIWPPVDARFGDDVEHLRVSRTRAWIIPKPHLRKAPRKPASWLAAAAIPPVLWGISNPLDLQGPEFLFFYAAISVFAAVVAFGLRQWLRQDPQPTTDAWPLDPHEVACLGGGPNGVLHSCLAGLVAQQKLEIVETPPTKIGPLALGSTTYLLRAPARPDAQASEIERVMLTAAGPDGAGAGDILKAAKTLADVVESDLQSRGLLESAASFGPAFWWPMLLMGSVWLLGLLKLGVGIGRDRPVGFLVMWLVAMLVVMFFFAKRPFRTRSGEKLFDELKHKYDKLKTANLADAPQTAWTDAMLVAGLFGLAAVDHPQIRQLHSALKPVPSSDGGFAGGCGAGTSGCGGGGGGGGCGGCGGGGD